MRRWLLPENGRFYKANLHAHSTVSDGALTPHQLKACYKAHGYSILSITDHEVLVDHSYLDDPDFLTITGMEYALGEDKPWYDKLTLEYNFYARDQHNTTQVCYNPEYVIHRKKGETWRGNLVSYVGEPFTKEFTLDCMQTVIDEANNNGFLVCLNHPQASFITPELFSKLDGLFAMEIYNHDSFIGCGVCEYNPGMYETMLRSGKRLYCIAADDCHSGRPDDDPKSGRYGGFVMIKAEALRYDAVINALEKGDFYASQGPTIEALYVEDDVIHLHCSPAKYVSLCTSGRPFGGTRVAAAGEYLTEVTFPLPMGHAYFRFDVMDEQGRHANTRAYSVDA